MSKIKVGDRVRFTPSGPLVKVGEVSGRRCRLEGRSMWLCLEDLTLVNRGPHWIVGAEFYCTRFGVVWFSETIDDCPACAPFPQDDDKPPFDLLPKEALEEIAKGPDEELESASTIEYPTEIKAMFLGEKFDDGKLRFDLLPKGALEEIVEVLGYGARKYSADNWKLVPDARSRYFAAAMRHIMAWHSGEEKDPESGLSHLAHAGCSILFLLWFEGRRNGTI